MKKYRAVVIGCSRMGAFIDNEGPGRLPSSHAAGYEACDRTDLVACSDLRTDVMEAFGKRYNVPKERQYLDYQEMLAEQRPDIVSVATQPEQRAEIVIYAVEHGVRAVYAEKAMAASLQEADAMIEAVERNGVAFNLGTNRRWDPRYDKIKEIIDSGRLGPLQTIIIFDNGTLFNMSSHWFDLVLRLNSDRPVAWVQAHIKEGDSIEGDLLREDPTAHGLIQFEDGVTAYALLTARRQEVEAICEQGVISAPSGDSDWQLRGPGPADHRGRAVLVPENFPHVEPASTSVGIIEDLVHALDTGEPTRGGLHNALASTELIFAFIESHLRGGARVEVPLKNRTLRLQRDKPPRQPRLTPYEEAAAR